VAAFYRKVRGRTRYHTVSAKHSRLAIFVAERPGRTWVERMLTWNRLHPAWRYASVSSFSRDARAAAGRLPRVIGQ
jgi:hypothetical protein